MRRAASVLGLRAGTVELASHHDAWAQHFADEKARLLEALQTQVLAIEHVGSTSIPGVPAKPILDIAVAVADFEEAKACIAAMEAIGCQYRGEHGVPRRHYFVRGEPHTHHVHMVEQHSQAWRDMLLFRDYLRSRPDAARRYAAHKSSLARERAADRKAYQAEKDIVVESILSDAREASAPRIAESVRAELERTRLAYRELLDSIPKARWRSRTAHPTWSVATVMFHITLALRFLPGDVWLIRRAGRVPKIPLAVFHKANDWYTRWGGRRSTPASVTRAYDTAHESTLASLKSVAPREWRLGVQYPGWDPLLSGWVSLEELFFYPVRHFAGHAAQVRAALAAGS